MFVKLGSSTTRVKKLFRASEEVHFCSSVACKRSLHRHTHRRFVDDERRSPKRSIKIFYRRSFIKEVKVFNLDDYSVDYLGEYPGK